MANINRRAKDADGKVSLGLNPAGPTDRQIGLMRLERADGSIIALVANYGIHGTVLSGRSESISGDAPAWRLPMWSRRLAPLFSLLMVRPETLRRFTVCMTLRNRVIYPSSAFCSGIGFCEVET